MNGKESVNGYWIPVYPKALGIITRSDYLRADWAVLTVMYGPCYDACGYECDRRRFPREHLQAITKARFREWQREELARPMQLPEKICLWLFCLICFGWPLYFIGCVLWGCIL